jgi:hypothetical protein
MKTIIIPRTKKVMIQVQVCKRQQQRHRQHQRQRHQDYNNTSTLKKKKKKKNRAKNHYFALIFSIKTDYKSAATSQWIEIESKAFQCWLHVTLRST